MDEESLEEEFDLQMCVLMAKTATMSLKYKESQSSESAQDFNNSAFRKYSDLKKYITIVREAREARMNVGSRHAEEGTGTQRAVRSKSDTNLTKLLIPWYSDFQKNKKSKRFQHTAAKCAAGNTDTGYAEADFGAECPESCSGSGQTEAGSGSGQAEAGSGSGQAAAAGYGTFQSKAEYKALKDHVIELVAQLEEQTNLSQAWGTDVTEVLDDLDATTQTFRQILREKSTNESQQTT